MEVKDTTYVEAARWGKHRGWRYVLGLVIILVAWLVVGTAASVLVAIALSGQTDCAALNPVGQFLYGMAGFPFFLAGILLTVSFIHRRYPQTLITARGKINWRRVGHGFVAWFVPFCLIGGLGQYLFYPSVLVAIPVFLAIAYGMFKQESPQSVSQSH